MSIYISIIMNCIYVLCVYIYIWMSFDIYKKKKNKDSENLIDFKYD